MQGYKGYSSYKHTLVATLGGKPQIVTLTLDLLLKRGISIYEVIVVYPAASPRIQQSLARLHAEFVSDRYEFEGRTLIIHFRQQILSHYDAVIDDIVDETTASGATPASYLAVAPRLVCHLRLSEPALVQRTFPGTHPGYKELVSGGLSEGKALHSLNRSSLLRKGHVCRLSVVRAG